jgi:nitrogen-specific signal transduction histidine kinase
MSLRQWFRPPRQLMLVFLVVAVASTAALALLTMELLAQDRGAEERRRAAERDTAADAMVAASSRAIEAMDARLDRPDETTEGGPVGTTLIVADPDGRIRTRPTGSLPYSPVPLPSVELADARLAAAVRKEFGTGEPANLAAAARAYAQVAAGASGPLRAAGLTGLARVSRKRQAWDAARAAYEQLEGLPDLAVDGLPAALIARVGLASMFESRHDASAVRREMARLSIELRDGRFQITRAQYDHYAAEVARQVGTAPVLGNESQARAEAFGWFWDHRAGLEARGRRVVLQNAGAALIAWRLRPGGAASTVVIGPAALQALAAGSLPAGLGWALTDPEGQRFAGVPPPARDDTTRTGVATGLPWTVHVFPSSTVAPPASPRRTLLLFVVASGACLLVAGWYFILRGISREIRVARLQSDFVGAVSHEFRSPLTSLRHIADLLASDRIPSDERRRRAYDVLVNETDRLGRLVEELLDFGRLQAGKVVFDRRPVEVTAFVRDVVHDFEGRPEAGAHRLRLAVEETRAVVFADREAIARAFWNLLDNAVKYSPAGSSVSIALTARHADQTVSIAVGDEGPGIPRDEQARIFERFVRGADAVAGRIRGTGLGLAMAQEIARAHGGRVDVASAPRAGSVFTLILPATPANLTETLVDASGPRGHG